RRAGPAIPDVADRTDHAPFSRKRGAFPTNDRPSGPEETPSTMTAIRLIRPLCASAIVLAMLAPACADSPVVKARIVADTSGTGPATVQATQTFKTMKLILDINGDKIELGTP